MQMGAVRYLNMLPYFFDSPDVKVFDTPSELNNAMRANECDVACMSTIAGIQGGFQPLMPMMGIASRDDVGSVFIEPLMQTETQTEFWVDFYATSARQSASTLLQTNRTRPASIAIFSSGASEQSLWLVRLLLSWQGHTTTVHLVDRDVSKNMSSHDLSQLLAPLEASQAVFLCIGDIALSRVFENKFICHGYRWDVALLWKHARGSPCIFATWFVRQNLAFEKQKHLASRLSASLERWTMLNFEQKLAEALAFLRQKNDPLLESLRASSSADAISLYFNKLDFVFSEPYNSTYKQYLTHSQVCF